MHGRYEKWRVEAESTDAEVLETWQKSHGKAIVDSFLQDMPQLAPFAPYLSAVPDSSDPILEVIGPTRLVEDLANLTTQAARLSHTDMAPQVLSQDIDSRCKPIYHDESPQIADGLKRPTGKKPSCDLLGVCLCSARGHLLFAIRNAFLKRMKADFCTAALKDDVDERRVFLNLESVDPFNGDPTLAELAFLTQGAAAAREPQSFWLSLGAHSWNPYRPCFKMFKRSDSDRERAHADEVFLEAGRASKEPMRRVH